MSTINRQILHQKYIFSHIYTIIKMDENLNRIFIYLSQFNCNALRSQKTIDFKDEMGNFNRHFRKNKSSFYKINHVKS